MTPEASDKTAKYPFPTPIRVLCPNCRREHLVMSDRPKTVCECGQVVKVHGLENVGEK